MDNENDYYISKISKKKHSEYCHKNYMKNKEKRHNQYIQFREKQKEYYDKRKANKQYPIPYKYLNQKDKQLYNQEKLKSQNIKQEDHTETSFINTDKVKDFQVNNKGKKKGLFSIFKK